MSEVNIPQFTPSGNGLDLDQQREALLSLLRQHPGAAPPSRNAQAALRRRYARLFVEISQIVARPPAGVGKRQRARLARCAEALGELREINGLMKAASQP